MVMKKLVRRYAPLPYPNFSEEFIIQTNARKTQLGGVIIQNGNPISFYSFKLTPTNHQNKILPTVPSTQSPTSYVY